MSATESGRESYRPQRTELVWEGKRTQVERIALPFQVVETINVSRATREETPLLAGLTTNPDANADGWRNKLIWGDNKYVLASLLEDFAGKIDLIYIDPPFATGADFSITVKVGDVEWMKAPSLIEEKVYRDTWGRNVDSYLDMMHERLSLMRELLSETGSIFVHLDWRVVHRVKLVLDELFGDGTSDGPGFRNEIIWFHNVIGTGQRTFPKTHETILWYSKSDRWLISPEDENVRVPYSDRITKTLKKDEKGWYYVRGQRESSGAVTGKWFKTYVDPREIEKGKFAADVWDDIKSYRAQGTDEFTGFPTQKPDKLIRRIVAACSRPGDLVGDFFCGAGTLGVVAEKITDAEGNPAPRRWIMCDLSRFAIHVTRKRLLDIPNCRAFEVLNLGKYERQHWQVVTNGHSIRAYLDFIVQLYRAERAQGFTHLHGRKAGRMVHVGATDAPVTLSEITEALDECAANNFRGLDVLGWEWEMGLHDLVPVEARKRGIDLRLLTIPREVMDKRAVEAGDVHFYELAYLDAEVRKSGSEVQVALRNFIIPNLELIPQDVRDKVNRWSDYVDFWAVDWDYQGDTFHNAWQSYRTRKHPALRLESDPHRYEVPGRYQVMVKVIDIFGNDTTKLIPVTVP